MSKTPATVSLDQRLARHFNKLGPRERRVAEFVRDHPEELAVYSAADLARLCDVSKATVTRLFKRLGYRDFRAVRDDARNLRRYGVPLAADARALGEGRERFQRHAEHEQANLFRCLNALMPAGFDAVVAALADTPAVAIAGFRNSYPVALHLRQQLCQARTGVHVVPAPNQSLAEDLAGLSDDTLIVLVGFRRRPRLFETLVAALRRREMSVLLIGDETAERYAGHVEWWLECPLDSVSAFDSYATAMSLVSLLSNAVLHRRLDQGRARISQISDLYGEIGELGS